MIAKTEGLSNALSPVSQLADWAKKGPRLRRSGTVTDVVRHRVNAFIDMQKRLLDVAAEQSHAVAESYGEGKVGMVGGGMAELARRAIEGFVETEKKFLDLAAQEVAAEI